MAYSPLSLPSESLLSCGVLANDSIASVNPKGHEEKIYKVRDVGHICNALITSNCISIGKCFDIGLEFVDNEQACRAVRTSLVQNETTLDNSVIQVRHYDVHSYINIKINRFLF